MLAAEVTFWFIIQTTASTLHTHGITNIQTADQAAPALEPLVRGLPYAGQIAKVIFALGVIGTGLLAVPVLAGSPPTASPRPSAGARASRRSSATRAASTA